MSVSVDVVHFAGIYFRVTHGDLHCACDIPPLGVGLGHVVGIRRASIAGKLTIDLRPAIARMFEFFEDEHTGSFSHDEAIPVPVKRTAGLFGLVIAQAQGFHRRKAGHAQRGDRRLAPAGQENIGFAILIERQASPSEWPPVAHAETMQMLGPFKSKARETRALAAFPIMLVIANGESREGP